MLNAVSYGAVVVLAAGMRDAELGCSRAAPVVRGPRRSSGTGIRYVRARPDIMLVMAIVFCAGTFGLNFQMTTALMATEVFGKGAGEYGMLGSILAVGSLAGSLLAARRARPRQRLVVVAAACLRRWSRCVAGLMPSYLTFAADAAAVRVRRAHRDHGRQRVRADGGGAGRCVAG